MNRICLGFFVLWLLMPLSAHANLVELENRRLGTSEWQLGKLATNGEIEGYASLTSVNRGAKIRLFVNTQDPSYRMDVYRMGWYGGAEGKLIKGGIFRKGIRQPKPVTDPKTGLIECNWKDPYVLKISDSQDATNWVSGIYLVKLTALSSGAQNYIIFVVREDDRRSDYLFQSSVTTYQAYNGWGGKSLYAFNSNKEPARKVSFNRPYAQSPHPVAAHGLGAGDFTACAGAHLPGLLGYEADRMFGSAPAGTEILAESPFILGGTQHVANMSSYSTVQGVEVLAIGSIQWSWALDDFNAPGLRACRLNDAAQQITWNVLARLGGDVFPIAKIRIPLSTRRHTSLQFSAEGSFDADGRIVQYRWHFGNDQIELGESVVHVFETTGRFEVTLTVRDVRGAASSTMAVIEITE